MQEKSVSVCVCVCLIFELRSKSGHTSVCWWWSLRCTHTPPKLIYPCLENQHNVLLTFFQHLMQERVVFCVPKHSTIKPRGEPFSAAPALIQQTWCAQILITSTHMCALLHHANDARHAAAVTCCCQRKQRLAQDTTRACSQWLAKCTECMHMDTRRADLGDWQER